VAKIQKERKLVLIDMHDSFTWNLAQLIEETNLVELDVLSNTTIIPEELEQYDGIILSPGPGLPKEHYLLHHLVEKYAPQKPILGVCLGMQVIAEVFGGKLYRKQQIIHGEQQLIIIKGDRMGIFKKMGESFQAALYHSWAVEKNSLPSDLEIIAENNQGIIMAIKHRFFPVWGVQFHPESHLCEQGEKLLRNWIARIQ
jgi:anthranilate synthase component II